MSVHMQTCPSCGEKVPIEYVTCVWCGYDLTAEHIRRSGVRIGGKQSRQRMVKVIKDPMNAFKEIALIPDNIGGRRIIYGIGLMMTLTMLSVFAKLQGLAYKDISQSNIVIAAGQRTITIPLNLILNIVFIIIQPLIFLLIAYFVWKVGTRFVSLLSKTVGGKGDRSKIQSVIGYSLLPVLLAWVLVWLIRIITPGQQVTGDNYSSVESTLQSITKSGIGAVGVIILWIGWIWATILAIIGIRHASKLSWVEAVFVAGIPYAIFMTIVL